MYESTTLQTSRGTFPILTAGPQDGPLALLLHGFPQLNICWEAQISVLAAAGNRVVAPNQRGYPGAPTGSYAMGDLADDVLAMIDALGAEKALVVAHDWGAAVAWTFAAQYPSRVSELVIMNCPPPQVFAAKLKSNPKQLLKTWYILFFQLPQLPELFISSRMPGLLVAGSYNRKAWNRESLTPYAQAFGRPEALHGPLGWYRAARKGAPRGVPIACPVLIIWGVHDGFFGLDLVQPEALSQVLADDNLARLVEIDAGHFVQNEAPDEVSEALLTWLAEVRS